MTYTYNKLNVAFKKSSLRIRYLEPAGAMGLDRSTVESLELLQNVRQTFYPKATIFQVLDNTWTPQGRRLLRASLLQPSTDAKVIKDRHDAVEEFTKNKERFDAVVKGLKGLGRVDLEKLAIWVSFTVSSLRYAIC
jgi:DNA mismatch repair protein MSH4